MLGPQKVVQNNSLLFRIGSAQRYFYTTLKLKLTDFVKNSSTSKDTKDIKLALYFILRLGEFSKKHRQTDCLKAELKQQLLLNCTRLLSAVNESGSHYHT